jgi:hypothetical protein
MRTRLAVTVLLAAGLVASVALAQVDKVVATFDSFAASGVTGDATLNPMPTGEVQIHSSLRGLVPNTEYIVLAFDQSTTCGEGTSSVQIAQFKSNPAGVATWNQKVALPITSIESLAIRVQPANTLVACATVPQ